ncbi:biotin-protein ligase [Polychytrium aggregatum]|uniref:biotin-protein ligase n=1 Tax=Polychytrium aggregatum TaxID=110093 RepID=UPI0022FF386B|nr:biotin-protein ligase [Polychytrium aggregatum]KAI9193432.1 biotin-protein ligase [Polychytrium aggregatum]
MNVLVYTGPGAGKGPIEQTIGTLRLHLSDSYDIISVDAATLLKEPWQATTKLLVLPGGRDLPYVEQLSPKVTSLIRDWVANDGGSFLGICAGAYFASRQVDFEPDRPSYKVVGERDLRFFDGSARGSIADGFIYNSEMGSKNCSITLDKPALGLDFDSLQVYVNGGPYFDLESLLPESPQPTVLAEYDPKDVSDKWKADSAQNKRYPAILECAIGRGKAILTGPHIEYQMRPLGSALAAKPGSEAIEWRDAVVSGLLPFEKQRSRLFRELLIRLGLNTNIRPERSDLDTSHDEPPKLTPMFLCFQPSPHVNVEDKIAQIRRPFDAAARSPNEPCVLEDDVNRLVLEDRQQDQYSDTMPVLECEQDDRPHKSVVKLCVCRDLSQIPRRDLLQFNIDRYLGYLKEYQDHWTKKQRWLEGTWKCGSVMLYGDIVESTQTLLDRNYKFSQSLPEGLVCVGSHQTAGRGRGRNSWISQSGCLQFSLALRHNDHKSIIFIQYLFGLAVVQALKSQSGYEV